MTLFELTLGDYSGDGHGKSRSFYLEVSDGVTREDLAANYAKNVAEFGFGLKDIADEYEDSSIDGEQLLTLLKAGFIDEPNLEKDPENPWRLLWDDDYIIEPEEEETPTLPRSPSGGLSWEENLAVVSAERQAGRKLNADEVERLREKVAERAASRVPLDLNGGLKPVKSWQEKLQEQIEAEEEEAEEVENAEPDEPADPWKDFDESDDYYLSPGAMFRIAVFFFTRGMPESATFRPVQVAAESLIGWNGVVPGFVGYGTFGR